MADHDPLLCGWVDDPEAVEQSCERMGSAAYLASAKPQLAGTWERMKARGCAGVFIWPAEEALLGGRQPSFHQVIGSCVSMGTVRAIQDSYYWAIGLTGEVGTAKPFATEPVYAGSRVEVGRGKLGKGDGSIGAWGAEWVHDYGLLARGVYGSIDLTKLRDDLAREWGKPGVGVPAELEALGKSHLVGACHRCTNTEQIADAVAAGYAVAFCSNSIWGRQRDTNGIARVTDSGGHCEEICGVAKLGSDTIFVRQNSWGNYYTGPDTLRYDGGSVRMREGMYGAYEADVAAALRRGEAWAFGDVQPWRPESVEEMT